MPATSNPGLSGSRRGRTVMALSRLRGLRPGGLGLCAATLAGVLLLFIASATAQTRPEAKGPDAKGDGQPRSEELDFEGDVVETSFLKPDASLIEGEARKGGASLLKIRRDFVPEIVRSAEDI